MAIKKPSAIELRFAYLFIQALGGNTSNMYLIKAVVAWVRRESGSHYIGNNPLNLRPGKDDAKYRTGTRKSRRTKGGWFSVYGSLNAAAKASANRLKSVGSWAGYRPAIKSMQRAMPKSIANMRGKAGANKRTEWLQTQAVDFLINIAMSKWSADHYGYGKTPSKTMSFAEQYHRNKLMPIWEQLLSTQVTLPKDLFAAPKKKPTPAPAKPLPKPAVPVEPPKPVLHRVPRRDYLDPYSMYAYYEDRDTVPNPLPAITMPSEW